VKPVVAKFIVYSLVGVVGTATHFAVLIFLVQVLATDPVAGSMAGFVSAALVNYALNYYVTFRSKNPHCTALLKFFVVALAGLCLNTLIMAVAVQWLHYVISQALAIPCVLAWNFLCNQFWTFKEDLFVEP